MNSCLQIYTTYQFTYFIYYSFHDNFKNAKIMKIQEVHQKNMQNKYNIIFKFTDDQSRATKQEQANLCAVTVLCAST